MIKILQEFDWPKLNLNLLFFTCSHSKTFVVTRCTTRFHSLSLVVLLIVIHCHLLYYLFSLVVIRCTTCCHSLSFVVIRCQPPHHFVVTGFHSFSLDVPLVSLFINDRFLSGKNDYFWTNNDLNLFYSSLKFKFHVRIRNK